MLYRTVISLPVEAKELFAACDKPISEMVRAALVQYCQLNPMTWKPLDVISDRTPATPPATVAAPARPVTQQPSSVESAKPATPTLSVSLPTPVPPEDLRDAHGTWDSQEDAEWYYAEMHKYEAARAAYNAAQVGTLDSLNYEEE
jgi:hypothetical protein